MAMDVQEIVWFVCVTIGLHTAVVGGLNVGLALIETRGLFKEAKIQRRQKKVSLFSHFLFSMLYKVRSL